MTIDQWATTISGFLAVLLAIGASFRWLIKHYLSELKPNGGSSMKDQVNRLEQGYDRLENKIDKVTDLLITHIEKNSN